MSTLSAEGYDQLAHLISLQPEHAHLHNIEFVGCIFLLTTPGEHFKKNAINCTYQDHKSNS